MTEERLKEIKDSIYIAHRISCDPAISMDFRDKEDLYNEVVRLREIIKEATDKLYCWGEILNADFQKGMLDILKQYNLTLEQINGIDNK